MFDGPCVEESSRLRRLTLFGTGFGADGSARSDACSERRWDVGRKQTPETKAKISESVKRRLEQKKMEVSDARARELAGHFATGHPDKKMPERVRNYGDMARAEGKVPERREKKSPSQEEREERANTTAEKLGLRRAGDIKGRKEGEPGGKVEASSMSAPGLSPKEMTSLGFTPTQGR